MLGRCVVNISIKFFLRGGCLLGCKIILNTWILIQYFNLVDVYFIVFFKGMPSQILHLNVNVQELHTLTYILLYFYDKEVVYFQEFLVVAAKSAFLIASLRFLQYLLLYTFLIGMELILNMVEKIFEKLAVVNDELIDDSPVHIDGWELIGISIDNFGHACKMSGDCLCV